MTTAQSSASADGALPPIEAFRAGRHVDSAGRAREWTAADLQELADTYDPKLSEAPVCIGHPKGSAPAFGWIGQVSTDGRTLQATPSTLQPEFQDWLQRRLFRKVSVSMYGREHPSNPVPGKLYLRHVGFLGAQPPAVKGLADYAFGDSDDDQHVIELGDWSLGVMASMFRGLREWLIAQFGADAADKALPGWSIDTLAAEAAREPERAATALPSYSEPSSPTAGDPSMTTTAAAAAAQQQQTAEFAEREARLAEERRALDARAAELDARDATARAAEMTEFADTLVKQGRLLPKDKPRVVAVLGSMLQGAEIEFAEGDGGQVKKPALQALRELLAGMPVVVDFSERAAGGGPNDVDLDDRDANAIAASALEFQDAEAKAGRVIGIDVAVQHVMDKRKAKESA
jgi:hypothetical protein